MEYASSQIIANVQQASQELRSYQFEYPIRASNSSMFKNRTIKRKLLSAIQFGFTSMFLFFTCLENIHKSVYSIQACTTKWIGMHYQNLWIKWCPSDIQVRLTWQVQSILGRKIFAQTDSAAASFFGTFCRHVIFYYLTFFETLSQRQR